MAVEIRVAEISGVPVATINGDVDIAKRRHGAGAAAGSIEERVSWARSFVRRLLILTSVEDESPLDHTTEAALDNLREE